jgi:uncharacterized membrane protein YraQ (UPF0718 family)
MKSGNNKKANKRAWYGFVFLAFVIIVYIVLFILNPENTTRSLKISGNILVHLIPLLLVVILFMGIANYFFKSKGIAKYLGKESGIKGWFIAAFAGILSHGPIYIWYPLLKDFHQKGMRPALMGVFLYNRAIKIPLLPLLIYYFGIEFAVLLMIWMILASFVEGKLLEIL